MAAQANKCGQKTIVSEFLNLVCRYKDTAEIPGAKTAVLQGICVIQENTEHKQSSMS